MHSAASTVAAVGLGWLAVRPGGRLAGWVGALVAATAVLRAGLIWFTVLFDGTPRAREQQVSFVLAGTIWATLAVVLVELWQVSVVPWVASRGTEHDP